MYPAHSQTIFKEAQTSYQNYVQQARDSPHWKQAEFDGFNLVGQGLSKPYCNNTQKTNTMQNIPSKRARYQSVRCALNRG